MLRLDGGWIKTSLEDRSCYIRYSSDSEQATDQLNLGFREEFGTIVIILSHPCRKYLKVLFGWLRI